jgi:hypothetical protein
MSFYICTECGSNKIENRDLGLCPSCNKARRDKENAKVKVVKPIKVVSERKAIELTEYKKLRKDFLSFKNACELKLPGCFISATEIHHNSMNEKDFLNTDTWTAICRNCHKKIETEMSAAERREKGLLTN